MTDVIAEENAGGASAAAGSPLAALSLAGSMAGVALRMDPYWFIEQNYAAVALISLLETNMAGHAAQFHDQGAMMSLTSAMLAVAAEHVKDPAARIAIEARIRATAEMPEVNGVADTSGTHKVPFGTNSDGSRKPYPIDGGVALLSITGPMTKAAAPSMSEGTSTVQARRIVRQAKSDGDVKAALIRFYTPGGQVAGNDDLATDVRSLAQEKPTFAYCEDMCASAGYYVASQCNAIYANPSAMIGSISTVMSFIDFSKMLEIAGVKVDVITPPDAPYKGAGTPGTALSEPQRSYYQSIVNTYAAQFRSVVQRGRGLTDAQMKQVTDGRVFFAPQARALGLIDGVTSYDNVLAKLKTYRPPKAA